MRLQRGIGPLGVLFAAWGFGVAAIVAPDGKMLTRNRLQKTIPVWETATGKVRLRLEGHQDSTVCVAFAPDGRTLASAGWDETIRLWDLVSGKELRQLTGHRGPADVAQPRRLLRARRAEDVCHG